jgi:hypothetical protein
MGPRRPCREGRRRYVRYPEEIKQAAEDMLDSFKRTSDGHRARAGQVQIGRWRRQIDGPGAAAAAETGG